MNPDKKRRVEKLEKAKTGQEIKIVVNVWNSQGVVVETFLFMLSSPKRVNLF